jgi:hypothetical protein
VSQALFCGNLSQGLPTWVTGYMTLFVFSGEQHKHDDWEDYPAMRKPTIDKNIIREQLKAKRNLLFDQYCRNPQNTRLAIEIRLLDDQVANLTQYSCKQTKVGLN